MPRSFLISTHDQLSRLKQTLDGMQMPFHVEVGEQIRSVDQSDKFHAMCHDLAEQKQWGGVWLSTEEWKRLLVAAWMKATGRQLRILPALGGRGFECLYQRTSKLSKKEMAELIEFTDAWMAENMEPERVDQS